MNDTSHIFRRFRIVSQFLGSQAIVQLLQIATGLLIVRILTVEDYATYSVFGAIVGAACIATDLGTNGAMTTLVSRESLQANKERLIVETAQIKVSLTLIALPLFTVLFFSTQTLSYVSSASFSAMLCLTVVLQTISTFYRSILACERRLATINRIDPTAQFIRLAFVLSLYAWFPAGGLMIPITAWAFSALLAAIIFGLTVRYRTFWPPVLPSGQLRQIVLPLLPGHIYYILNGILPLLSLTLTAPPSSTAEFGALGRLSAIFSLVGPLMTLIVHPYVSRGGDRGYTNRSLSVLLIAIFLNSLLIASGYTFPETWLMLLGHSYSHLIDYVAFALLVTGITQFNGILHALSVAGGETSYQYLVVIAGLVVQFAAMWLNPIHDISSALQFALLTGTSQLIVLAVLFVRGVLILQSRSQGTII